MDAFMLNGSNLAYIGDAYYELMIRNHLISKGITKNKELRQKSIMYVSASSHEKIFNELEPLFSEVEKQIFNRGRNNAPKGYRKNVNRNSYLISSGFEAIIGYLYLNKEFERLNFLFEEIYKIVEE